MAVLSVQDIPVGGFQPTLAAADAAGDEAPVGDGVFVYVSNGSASAITVTFDVPVTVGGVVNYAPSVAAGAALWLPLRRRNPDPEVYSGKTVSRTSASRAQWTYSATTSVEVAVLRAL